MGSRQDHTVQFLEAWSSTVPCLVVSYNQQRVQPRQILWQKLSSLGVSCFSRTGDIRRWQKDITQSGIPHICHFFLHEQNFWRIKFTPKKMRKLRQNTQKIANFLCYYGKIHSKLPIFRVKSVKIYTGQKNLHGHVRGDRDKYQVWSHECNEG